MAIKYPGEQKIGYGEAQIFDTQKLADNAGKIIDKIKIRKEKKKKSEADFLKDLKDIDVSKVRNIDIPQIHKKMDAVTEYYYNNMDDILNPKNDGGKAALMVQKLKQEAILYTQQSRGQKVSDDEMFKQMQTDSDHYGTQDNRDKLHKIRNTCIGCSGWDDETKTTDSWVESQKMTDQEKDDFYNKSETEQASFIKKKQLDHYNSLSTIDKQQFLLDRGETVGSSKTAVVDGETVESPDGNWGNTSTTAETNYFNYLDNYDYSTASDIASHDTYEDYVNTAGDLTLTQDEFNTQKGLILEYETTWEHSQGLEDIQMGGEDYVVQGAGSFQLAANPRLDEQIQETAKLIQPDEIEEFKDGDITKFRAGDGNVTLYSSREQASKSRVINAITNKLNDGRFKNESWTSMQQQLNERNRGKEPENFMTMDDLILEKALPFVESEYKEKWVSDIMKHSTRINVQAPTTKQEDFITSMATDTHYRYINKFEDSSKGGHDTQSIYGVLNQHTHKGANIQGVQLGGVTGTTTGGKPSFIVSTDGVHGFQILSEGQYTNKKGINKNSTTDYQYESDEFNFMPDALMPTLANTSGSDIKLLNGMVIKPGQRIPETITHNGNEVDVQNSKGKLLYPTTNKDGDYVFSPGTGMEIMLYGTIEGTELPIIMPFKGSVVGGFNSWVESRARDDGHSVKKIYNMVGLGTSRL